MSCAVAIIVLATIGMIAYAELLSKQQHDALMIVYDAIGEARMRLSLQFLTSFCRLQQRGLLALSSDRGLRSNTKFCSVHGKHCVAMLDGQCHHTVRSPPN
jgi:hypothetical protein